MKWLLFFLLFITGTIHAQEMPIPDAPMEERKDDGEFKTFEKVETEARFKGDWSKFQAANLKYPKKAEKKGITGTVTVEFVVGLDGHIGHITLSRYSAPADQLLVKEAIRLIGLTDGQWTPARQNGRPVKAYCRQPVNFVLTK